MALLIALYSLEAVIAESGILPFCIPRASRHKGGFGVGKPFGVKYENLGYSNVDILHEVKINVCNKYAMYIIMFNLKFEECM